MRRMSNQVDKAKDLIQAKNHNVVPFERQMTDWFRSNSKRLVNFAGSEDSANRLMSALFHSASLNPQLQLCTATSLGDCLMQSAQLNLFPGAMQECAYVPFFNNKKGCQEAKFIAMVGGLCRLAYQSGFVRDIDADIVYERDVFTYSKGTNSQLVHVPFEGDDKDRGKPVRVYAVVHLSTGGKVIKVKNMDWIEARRKMSRVADSGPWKDHYDEMAVKAIVKYALKYVPKSPTLAQAIALDNDAEIETTPIIRPVPDFGTLGPANNDEAQVSE